MVSRMISTVSGEYPSFIYTNKINQVEDGKKTFPGWRLQITDICFRQILKKLVDTLFGKPQLFANAMNIGPLHLTKLIVGQGQVKKLPDKIFFPFTFAVTKKVPKAHRQKNIS